MPPCALGVDETVGGGFARLAGDPLAGHRTGEAALLPLERSVSVTSGVIEEQRAADRAQTSLGPKGPDGATGERRAAEADDDGAGPSSRPSRDRPGTPDQAPTGAGRSGSS